MNERTNTRLYKNMNLSHFILERVDVSVVRARGVERHILRERTSSHIYFQKPGGANACTPWSSSETPLVCYASLARLWFSALSLNLTAWFSSRDLLPVTHLLYPSALITLLFTNHNVTACHGVTRNEPKIHVICYITFICMLFFKMSTYRHFLHVSRHLPSTPYTKQNNNKNKKTPTWTIAKII